jgi:8-oxo-dGTP pyrophosphatase MutT (NUDIX family)
MENKSKNPVTVKGVVFEGNRVWLRLNERGEWELPGGKPDPELDKTLEDTVVRELDEELGFQVEPLEKVGESIYELENQRGEVVGVNVISYLCRFIAKVGEQELEGEAGKAEFNTFDLDEVSELNMPSFYKEAINVAWERWQLLQESVELDNETRRGLDLR